MHSGKDTRLLAPRCLSLPLIAGAVIYVYPAQVATAAAEGRAAELLSANQLLDTQVGVRARRTWASCL